MLVGPIVAFQALAGRELQRLADLRFPDADGICAERSSSVRFLTFSARCSVAIVTLSPAASSRAIEGCVIPSLRASCACVRPSAARASLMIDPALMHRSRYRSWTIDRLERTLPYNRPPMRIAMLALALLLARAATADAVPPAPIPEGPGAGSLQPFIGAPARPRPVTAVDPPRHPFMAPNSRSNLHVDAYQTDVHQGPGPLGKQTSRVETFLSAECASVTFDSRGRIVTVCVGVDGPKLFLMDATTLETLATFPLPPRIPAAGNIFTDFGGGGYFYLDEADRAVIPTTTRHILVVEQEGAGFALERDYDVSGSLALGDKIISALPDWSGRLWFVSQQGVVGTVDRTSGAVTTLALGERIENSFAVDETGGVYVVTETAMYRLDAGASGAPAVTWREVYENSGIAKPGQVGAGSGTTPTLLGRDLVAITDNADPMNVVVYRRGAAGEGPRTVCVQPVFEQGASATDNSLIGAGRSLIVENNYGYSGPTSTQDGKTTTPGLERVDLDADGTGCRSVWRSQEIAPTVVPKLSAANGIVYTYTKDPQPDGQDAWYLTALDFRTGRTLYKRLGGEGLGHNNNYAPVTLGPDGTAYVGVLGGLIGLRDATPPPGAEGGTPARHGALRLQTRRLRGGRLRLRVVGKGVRQVRRVEFRARGEKVRVDRRRPFAATVARKRLKRSGRTTLAARIVRKDGTRTKRVNRVRRR